MSFFRFGRFTPAVFLLEQRYNPNTYTVTDFVAWDDTVQNTFPWAVKQANLNPGFDTINFAVPQGQAKSITSTSTVTVTDAVMIQGPTLVNTSITITGVKPLVFHAVPLNPAGAEELPPQQVTEHYLNGVTFQDCVGASGGAVEVCAMNAVTALNCAFIENKSPPGNGGIIVPNDGGAVFVNQDAKLIVGGSALLNPVSNGTFSAAQTVFLRNEATSDGGAIANQGVLVLQRVWFQGNQAASNGGAINVYKNDSRIEMTAESGAATFKQNKALNGNGGGIHFGSNHNATSTLVGVAFTENDAQPEFTTIPSGVGGGVFVGGGNVNMSGGLFHANTAGKLDPATRLVHGGAAALGITDGHVTLTNVEFDTNNATAAGGAVYGVSVSPTGWLTIGTGVNFIDTPLAPTGKID
jgi:predicted outer membrane repeat protein